MQWFGPCQILHSVCLRKCELVPSLEQRVVCNITEGFWDGFWAVVKKQCGVFPHQASSALRLFCCGLLSMLFMVGAYTFSSLTSFK